MSDLVVEQWPLNRLRMYGHNPRKNDDNIGQMVDAIRAFGFRIPIVARSDGEIVDGHLRFKAAREMGLETVPVALADDLTPAQVRAFRLLANKSASWATWDDDLLRTEMIDLKGIGFDLNLTGFDADEVAAVLHDVSKLGDPQAVPELPKRPVSRPGDLWRCGTHSVLCGDSTNAADVARLLSSEKPNLMVTDPPYGVEYNANWRNEVGRSEDGGFQRLKSGRASKPIGARAIGKVMNDDRADWREAWALFPGDVAYVWCSSLHSDTVINSLEATGLVRRTMIIWAKDRFVISRGDYHWQHEPCWYAVRKGARGNWQGDRSQTTIWNISHRASETGHSTQKPLDCMRRPIVNNSDAGEAVYDPFLEVERRLSRPSLSAAGASASSLILPMSMSSLRGGSNTPVAWPHSMAAEHSLRSTPRDCPSRTRG